MAELKDLLAQPTAVVTCEMQRGVIGDHANNSALARAVAAHGVIDAAARLLGAARARGVRVVHATMEMRADRAGLVVNTPLLEAVVDNPEQVLAGHPSSELVPELGPEPGDIMCPRMHGLTPFTGTELDAILRGMRIRTIIPMGVSTNEAISGLCLSAADLGYFLALPTDAVDGTPEAYVRDQLKYSLRWLATLTTVDEILSVWDGS